MNVKDMFDYITGLSKADIDKKSTTDTLRYGSWDKEIKKIAVTCIATVDVIKEVLEWGADLIITHESTFYHAMDKKLENDKVTHEKLKLLENSDISIIRFHDYMHGCEPDMIGAGEFYYLGLEGEYIKGKQLAINRFNCKNSITPLELAKLIEEKLGIKYVRICGARDAKCTKISACFGGPDAYEGVFSELRDNDIEIVLSGETCEWLLAEYARDAAALGFKKSLLMLGHMGSERDGMKYLSKHLEDKFNDLNIKYFDCKEVFSYTKN